MEDQFVPYELAVKLKELGFNNPCIAGYNDSKTLLIYYPNECYYGYRNIKEFDIKGNQSIEDIGAPLWQQAFDWFRDTHKLSGEPQSGWFSFEYKIIKDTLGENQCIATNKDFKTYKEARLACLEKLIELC